jgi:hypothetical protein
MGQVDYFNTRILNPEPIVDRFSKNPKQVVVHY